LDRDFFEWLKRFKPSVLAGKDKRAVEYVIRTVLDFKGPRLWDSMEKAFYTLHIRAQLEGLLMHSGLSSTASADELLENFTGARHRGRGIVCPLTSSPKQVG
jgi:hypothetical protein